METKTKKPSQRDQILAALRNGDILDGMQALERFGSYTGFAMRICELRKIGWKIQDEYFKSAGGANCKRYWLEPWDRDKPTDVEPGENYKIF